MNILNLAQSIQTQSVVEKVKKYKYVMYVLIVFFFFFLLPKPNSPFEGSEKWWNATWFQFVIGTFVAILLVWLLVFLYQKLQTKKPEKEAEKPAGAGVTTQPVVKTTVATKNSSVVWIVLLLATIAGLVWFYVLPSHPDVVSPKTLESMKDQSIFKLLAPYIFAPLLGLISYYWSRWGFRSVGASIVVILVACLVITFWVHPDVLKAMVTPFLGETAMTKVLAGPSMLNLFLIVTAVCIVAGIMGYLPEVLMFVLIMLFFLAILYG